MSRNPFVQASVRRLIQQTPPNGCLMVFNADHANWRSRVCETEILECHVMDPGQRGRPKAGDEVVEHREGYFTKRYRDIYICLKEG